MTVVVVLALISSPVAAGGATSAGVPALDAPSAPPLKAGEGFPNAPQRLGILGGLMLGGAFATVGLLSRHDDASRALLAVGASVAGAGLGLGAAGLISYAAGWLDRTESFGEQLAFVLTCLVTPVVFGIAGGAGAWVAGDELEPRGIALGTTAAVLGVVSMPLWAALAKD